jgi:hypothetical protein
VASFYDSIDHEVLSQEIVDMTGDTSLADAVAQALGELMLRGYGLPQGPNSSDVFATFLLARIDRSLLRRGIVAHRANDDFRIPASSRAQATRALLALESDLRDIGLSLNYMKSRAPSRKAYEKFLEEREAKLEELAPTLRITTVGSDEEYGFDPDTLQAEAATLDSIEFPPKETVEKHFADALRETGKTWSSISGIVIAHTLPLLGMLESEKPLGRLPHFIERHSSLVRYYWLYLRFLRDTTLEKTMVEKVARYLETSEFILPWTAGWLIDALARASVAVPPDELADIYERFSAVRMPWFVRGRTVLLLATHGEIASQEEIAEMYSEAPPPTKVDIAAAVTLAAPDWAGAFAKSIGAKQPLPRAVPGVLQGDDAHIRL